MTACDGTGSDVGNSTGIGNDADNGENVNIDPKTIVITNIPMSVTTTTISGIVGIFPVTTSNDQAIADFTAFFAGEGSIQYMVASNLFDYVDKPVIDLATGTFNFTVPLRAVQGNDLGRPWTGSGTFNIFTGTLVRNSKVINRVTNVNISSATTSVSMPASPAVTLTNLFPSITGTINLTGTPPSGLRRVWLNVTAFSDNTFNSVIWWNESSGENAVDFTGTLTNIPWVINASNLVSFPSNGGPPTFPAYLRFELWLVTYDQHGHRRSGHMQYSQRVNVNSLEELLSRNFVLGDVSFNP